MAGVASLHFKSIHENSVTAGSADQTDIGAEPDDFPLLAPTGMRATQLNAVPDLEGDRCGHRSFSATVAPVKFQLSIRAAGTRAAMPE